MSTANPKSKIENRKLSGWFVFVQVHDADKGQVAIILVEVEPVAEDEFVRDGEAAVMDGDHRLAPFGFVEQGTDLQAARLAELEQFQHRGDGMTTVDDVLDQKDVPVADVDLQVHCHADGAARLAFTDPVGGDSHEKEGRVRLRA